MKVIDYFMRGLTVATFVALVASPEKWGARLGLFSLVAMGMWALLYPQGIIGWARTAHPQLDPQDASMWWVPRFIGVGVLMMVVLVAIAFKWRILPNEHALLFATRRTDGADLR